MGRELDVEVVCAVVRNRYVGRTFIMSGQEQREVGVRQKHSVVASSIAGKHVLLVDDSIVRGTTGKRIVNLVREAGAAKITFASASPPLIAPNIYGIDLPEAKELIAYERSIEEVGEFLGADRLVYLELERFLQALSLDGNGVAKDLELSVFTGQHVVDGIDDAVLARH